MTATITSTMNLYITELKNLIAGTAVVDHYITEREEIIFNDYKDSFIQNKNDETTFRNRFVGVRSSNLDFNYFINYGSMYGWIENEMSKTHNVIGIDRSEIIQGWNRKEFGKDIFKVSNDIFTYLKENENVCKDSLFSLINIGTLFSPEYLKELFKTLYNQDFKYVSLFEPFGLSIQTFSYYKTDENRDKNSVIFRGACSLHNYPRILKEAGFEIKELEIVKPPHPTDILFKSIYILGEAI